MARSGVREGNARVTAGKSDGVVHIEIAEWPKSSGANDEHRRS
jgi:hypothetical protein